MSGWRGRRLAATPHEPAHEVRTFDAIYGAQFDFVYRCLRRLGVPAAHAEDAAQDTFMVLHKRLADLRPDASVRGFLFAVAMRIAKAERRERWHKRADSLEHEPLDVRDPFEHALHAQAARTLERFLLTLDDDQRIAFMLTELEELSAPEIADALEVPVNTVYSRVRLARERLVRFLRTQGRAP